MTMYKGELILVVAEAIYNSSVKNYQQRPFFLTSHAQQKLYTRKARAVILAMYRPVEIMIEATTDFTIADQLKGLWDSLIMTELYPQSATDQD